MKAFSRALVVALALPVSAGPLVAQCVGVLRGKAYRAVMLAARLAMLLTIVFAAGAAAEPTGTVRGRVVDESGAAVAKATVTLYRPGGAPVAWATADAEGAFALSGVARGRYELTASGEGFLSSSTTVEATEGDAKEVKLVLRIGPASSAVTVTAWRGLPEDVAAVPNGISVVTPAEMLTRPGVILPQLLREEPGVQLQQTSGHQGAVLVRGLTGQQVLHLIDGVRYNNSTFRPGPNQYLATVDTSFIEQMEVSRGPSSTQYGSDSLGGTLNLLPARPLAGPGPQKFHGELAPVFRSADLAGGSSLKLSYGTDRWNLLGGGSFRRAQDLQAGQGGDSHAAVTRFLGLPSSVLGERLQDTAYSQWGSYARFFANVRPDQTLSLTYHHGEQRGGRRYDQLNGGNGNLINAFDPQRLDFFYARYEKQRLGWLDSVSGVFSVNRQRDDRRFQGGSGNPLATITSEGNVATVYGYQGQAATHIGARQVILFGGELYDEYIGSSAQNLNPATGATTAVRGRYPDGTRYRSYGFFGQHSSEWLAGRLRTQAGVRVSGIHFETFGAKNLAGTVPNFSANFRDVTLQGGFTLRLVGGLSAFASVAQGFRAPNTTDFSAVGLTSNGFEVSPEVAARAGGFIGTTASNTAVSTGRSAGQLEPEKLLDYEGGLRLNAGRVSGSVSLFQYNLTDFITKRTLILPAGAVGQTIGGATITQQLASGAVITAVDPRAVITRANVGRVRLRGFEGEARVRLTTAWSVRGNVSYLRGRDMETGGVPDIEGGLPPVHGMAAVRWQPSGRAWWVESYTLWSDKQDRLSSLELADQRIGAVRTRSAIASFFNNGAVARGLVAGGVLLATGETLAQVQNRVLGIGVNSSALFSGTAGFATLNLRGGYRVGERSELIWIFENVLDKNYRLHGSGVDTPGRGVQVSYVYRF